MDIRLSNLWTKLILLTAAVSPLCAQTTVVIDGPTANAVVSGTVTVSGWALDTGTSGSAIASVAVLVDGTQVGTASYGVSRPDVCAQYSGPGCPNVGYAYSLNTAPMGAGNHTITVIGTDSASPANSGSATVQVQVGPPPAVAIDSPTVGSVVSGTINVTGWALDTGAGTPISSVQVLVDGVLAGNATYGTPRPDVCTVYPGQPGCPNVGYSYALNTTVYTPGSHVITVTATDSDNNPVSGSLNVTVTVVVPPSVMIDSLTPGEIVTGTVTVGGWAIDSATTVGTAISSVQILVDGNAVGLANYGVNRPDVCIVYPGRPGCPNVGFQYSLNTSTLAPGSHTVTAVATDTETPPQTASWAINITVVAAPTVTIESPATGASVSGRVVISGWALDSAASGGAVITTVQISVDGNNVGTATYGLARPDVCNTYPGRPGCPNVGFTYTLDTTSLSAGSHVITVSATDASSPPLSGSSTVTINVSGNGGFALEAPTNGSVVTGVVTVSGWALAPIGALINSVKIYVDGTQVGLAYYGLLRQDICGTYPGSPGCPYVGFSYSLNTANISDGAHTVMAVATTEDGAPPVGSGSVTITVNN